MDSQSPNLGHIQTFESQILPNWHLAQQNEAGGHASWHTCRPVAHLNSGVTVWVHGPSVFQGRICSEVSVFQGLERCYLLVLGYFYFFKLT